MPMDGKLSTTEIATIKRWIDEGAPWGEIKDSPGTESQLAALEDMKLPPEARQYWAFQKPVRRERPHGTQSDRRFPE